jgi:hypothetical protein
MSGVLQGFGETAKCMVSALRVTLEGTRLFKDCQFSIEWVSRPLPEGNYRLQFDDKTIQMNFSKDGWREVAGGIANPSTPSRHGLSALPPRRSL